MAKPFEVVIPEALRAGLKEYAEREGMRQGEVIRLALREFLLRQAVAV